MNAERLLAHFEKSADSPDAIVRLRRFLLDLAVRGKLTSYRFEEAEILPLGNLSEFIMGQAPPGSSCNENGQGTVFVKVGEFGERFPVHAAWTTEPLKFAKQGDVLICVVGATIGKLNLAINCAIGRSVAAIRPQARLDQVFLYYSLMPVTMRLRDDSRGTAQGVISRPDLAAIPVWCPPLAEQHRIVAKVDELMSLCDQLEAARAGREEVRDRLAASSLARLNAPDPETFQEDARFVLNALPALTSRPDQIKRLRQTILNLAVRGKLVPQDPKDEPASELLKRIAGEKARLVKAGEIRKPKPSEPIHDRELPIRLPTNWAWARLCEIGNLSGGMTPSMNRSEFWDGDIVWLSPKDIKSDEVADSELKISALGLAETRLELYRPGCLFMVARSGILKRTFPVSINRVPAAANQDMKVLAPFLDGQERYLQIMFRGLTDFLLHGLVKTGTTVQSLKYAEFEQQPFPLPPLDEQHRIVAKVDELMALCGQLEASLSDTAAARRRLLDALLAEALVPEESLESVTL